MLTCYLLDGRLNFTIKYLTAVIFRCASLKYIYRQRTSPCLRRLDKRNTQKKPQQHCQGPSIHGICPL